MKNINEKITLKGLTINLQLLIKSKYTICAVENHSRQLNIKKYDVVSTNNKLFVHKYAIGDFFTYRISESNVDEFCLPSYRYKQTPENNPDIHVVLKL